MTVNILDYIIKLYSLLLSISELYHYGITKCLLFKMHIISPTFFA